MLTCGHCGTKVQNEQSSCPICGRPLAKPSKAIRGSGVELFRQTLTAPMLAVDPSFDPKMRPELQHLLQKWKASSSQSVLALHLMGQNYPLSDIQALRELLQAGLILPDTPVFHRWKDRWFSAEQCPGLHSKEPIDPDDTKRLDGSDLGEENPTKPSEPQMILAARLGNMAEEAASQNDDVRAIEIYEEVLRLHPHYPLVKKRLRQLRQKLVDDQQTKHTPMKPASMPLPTAWDDEKTAMSGEVLLQSSTGRAPTGVLPAGKVPVVPAVQLVAKMDTSEEEESTGILTLEDVMGEQIFAEIQAAQNQTQRNNRQANDEEEKTSLEANSVEIPVSPVELPADHEVDTLSVSPRSNLQKVVAEELELLSEDEFPTAQKPASIPTTPPTMTPTTTPMFTPIHPPGTSAVASIPPMKPKATPLFSTLSEATSLHQLRAEEIPGLLQPPVEAKEKTVWEKESGEENRSPGLSVQVGLFQAPGTLPKVPSSPVLSVTPPPFQAFETGPLAPSALSSVLARANAQPAKSLPQTSSSARITPSAPTPKPEHPILPLDTTPTAPTAVSPPWQVRWGEHLLDWQQLATLCQDMIPTGREPQAWLQSWIKHSTKFCHVYEGSNLVAVGRILSDHTQLAVISGVTMISHYHQHDPLFRLLMESLLHDVSALQVLCVIHPRYMPMAQRVGFTSFSNTMLYVGGNVRAGSS